MKKKSLRPKLSYLGIFELEFEKKTIVIFKISNFIFIKNEFLTNIANFDIRSVFSKGPGDTFSDGPDSCPGPFCKLYRLIDSSLIEFRFFIILLDKFANIG